MVSTRGSSWRCYAEILGVELANLAGDHVLFAFPATLPSFPWWKVRNLDEYAIVQMRHISSRMVLKGVPRLMHMSRSAFANRCGPRLPVSSTYRFKRSSRITQMRRKAMWDIPTPRVHYEKYLYRNGLYSMLGAT